jgi:hypothetical protein
MLCVAKDVCAVVDAVEVNGLSVIVFISPVGGGLIPAIDANVDRQSMCDIISP